MKNTIRLKSKNNIWLETEYEIIRSRRTSYSIALKEDGSLTVRVPFGVTDREAERLLHEKQAWITKKLNEQKLHRQNAPAPRYTPEERTALEKRYQAAAKEYIPKRVEYYTSTCQDIIGDHCLRITIRDQKTRWGSCSSRKTLSFNWKLMLAPPAVLDYVVVHELCHLKHMNHSAEFWNSVEAILPDYKLKREWLKEHGHELTLS